MRNKLFSIFFRISSFFLILIAVGFLTAASFSGKEKNMSHGYANYIIDNGQKLLGKNDYPAISYSGYRTASRTDKNCPTVEEIKEDMKILSAMGVRLLRTYNTQDFPQTSRMLQAIHQLKQGDPDFEMVVMLGAWITCKGAYGPAVDHSKEDFQFNKREIDTAIKLADQYPAIVKIIAVGNEAMVTWQAHFVPASVILKWVNTLKDARNTGKFPPKTLVTTSDNWAALGGQQNYHNDDLLELLKQIDFVSLHTYAFHDTYYDPVLKWSVPTKEVDLSIEKQAGYAVKRAVAHQITQYEAVKHYLRENGINKEIHIGETGWASLDNSYYGDGGTCAASEYNAKLFYDAVRKWTAENNLTCFYFEAFNEPWKSSGTTGSEGHFGLFTVGGKAKYPLWDLVDAGDFKGLTRGGNAIVKTHDGDKKILLEKLKAPVFKKN
jgi:exo-beta-1,3-glucanase (GH17 family)